MQNISKGLSRVERYRKSRTNTFCDKHSVVIRNTNICTYTEIVPFNEELGPYHGPETEIINGATGTFCNQCRKEEKISPEVERFQQEAQAIKENSKNLSMIKKTSAVLKEKSIISDQTIKKATFDSFRVTDEGTKRLKESSLSIAYEILNGSENMYVFAGKTGRGKSHLSMAILTHVTIQSYKQSLSSDSEVMPLKCLYVSFPKLITLINETYNMSWDDKENYEYTDAKMKKLIAECDVVVLDDLGAEVGGLNTNNPKATDSQIRLLTELLNSRQGKATIVSTNIAKNKIKEVYDERIDSRINKNIVGLEFNDTTDKRK